MSGPVQLIPPGLLGFLGLKTLGRAPGELVDTYQPCLETLEWLLSSQAREWNVAQVTPTVAAGFFTFTSQPIVVPAGEWWWLNDYSILAECAAATTITVAPCAAFPQVTNRLHLLGDYVNVNASDQAMSSGNRLRGWFIPPTTIIGIHVRAFTAAPVVTGWLRYSPLPI